MRILDLRFTPLVALALLGVGCSDQTVPTTAATATPARSVAALETKDTGWIRGRDIYVDEQGVVWVDASAEVLGKADPRLADVPHADRVFIGKAQGEFHVSLDRLGEAGRRPRERPAQGRWVAARSLTDVVRRIRGGDREIALAAPPAGTDGGTPKP